MSRPGPRCALALSASLLLLSAQDAGADPAVIARVGSTHSPLDARLDAELTTLGFAVKDVDEGGGADLGAVARANGAVAAIRVNAEGAIELWVEPRGPEGAPVHEVVPIEARRGWDVAAVQALEALRAHLLRIREAPLPASPPPPPPPAALPPPRPWLWLRFGAGFDASPGGFGAAADLLLEVRAEPRPWLAFALFGAGTPLETRVDGPEGGATLRRGIAGGAVDLVQPWSRAALSLGVGGALVAMDTQGTTPTTGYAARDAQAWAAAPLLRGGASLRLAPFLRVRAEIVAGVTFPRLTLSFAGREAAAWGRPLGLFTLGVEWGVVR
ncbi:MAG TPA: hypothetical protein VGI39_36885 [Polyangiaceae bacterium]|jgi:hypothetical protein